MVSVRDLPLKKLMLIKLKILFNEESQTDTRLTSEVGTSGFRAGNGN